jgi:hypothetical protein
MTSGNHKIQVFPEVMDDPQKAFSSQLAIVQTVCQQLAGLIHNPDWTQVTSLIPTHLLTDLDIQQFQTEWETLLSLEQNPNCRFPTLEISGIDH